MDGRPIRVDTEEVVPLTKKIKRLVDHTGHRCTAEEVKWRNLRTFQLVDGSCNAPLRSSTLIETVRRMVDSTFASVMHLNEAGREDLASTQEVDTSFQEEPTSPATRASNTTQTFQPAVARVEGNVSVRKDSEVPRNMTGNAADSNSTDREIAEASSAANNEIPTPDSAQYASARAVAAGTSEEIVVQPPSDLELVAVNEYLQSIPTRGERAKIRHQPKQRAGTWRVSRSRNRRNQKKCAVTRSGTQIYHAHTLKAQRTKAILRFPGIKARLIALRERRPDFVEPSAPTATAISAVKWPNNVKYIEECKVPEGIEFPDIGDGDPCNCEGDYFMDSCSNAALSIFCTRDYCSLNAACSNAPLKLYNTGRVGLGVFTTTPLDVGDIVGEYAGRLCEYAAVMEGQPKQAVKQNSGYTMLLNANSKSGKFVYIEALKCGSHTRFMSHACRANVAFFERQNRSTVKVLAVMIDNVGPGAQLTVNYGRDNWFKCACDECWNELETTED